jgi:hypothetical protein
MIDGADNKTLPGVLNNLMNNAELSGDEKQAMFMYANDLVKLRGFNIGNVVAAANGFQAPPKVSGYNIRGNTVEEIDEQGNVLSSQEYENSEAMKAGLYELQQARFDNSLNSDIGVMKSRPGNQYDTLLQDFLLQSQPDMLPSDFEAILAKPSLERTEAEQQMVSQFANILHDTVYDSTILHEEQSIQDGEMAADNTAIDIEQPNPDIAADITAKWQEAQAKREEAFANNEDLMQEVLSMEQQGLSHQEIISALETFRPEEQQAVIDYYNQKASYESFINRLSQKIDEEAANSRQRHTFKGTVNGQADLRNVYTITDGTNEYYLVSGNITTDSEGRITGSDSGLIIGMDLDGSFVNIGDTSGYSVMPSTQTLEQFEEQERIRLQEQVTGVIDPNQTMNPNVAEQPQTEQNGTGVEVAGGEAGQAQTGANEPSAATPSVPETDMPAQPAEEVQPAVPIESVTDKDGIKRYENGIPVDDAIADIQNDGFDVNEIADASIAEAQATVDKINGKATKTRKDLVDKKKAQDIIDYYNNVKARWAEMNQPAESEENVNVQPEQPIVPEKTVSSQSNSLTVEEQKQQRIAEAKAKYGELFDDDFAKANDVYELVSMWVGRNRNLAWDDVNGKRGLQKELGWTRKIGGDTKFIETLLAKKGEGVGIDEFAHIVWESEENTVDGEKRFTTEEIKEALLELLKSAQSKSDVVDFALNNRIAQAEAALQEQQKQAAEQTEKQAEIEPLTDEEIQAMEANLPFAQPTDEEIENLPINQLRREIDALSQEEDMPPIQLVDTDRMDDGDWIDFASMLFDGAFLSQEEVDETRRILLEHGVIYNDETGNILVLSGNVNPEEVRAKVEQIKTELNNGRSIEEKDGGLETDGLQPTPTGNLQGNNAEAEGAPGIPAAESPRGSESVDQYLQPRNAEEEKIVATEEANLAIDIQNQKGKVAKAKKAYDQKRKEESDRATDMFSDDETRIEQGQLFGFDEMPTDRSQEGVNHRAKAEKDALDVAQAELDRLQSQAEHDSRVRGALDNHRRQTRIETEEQSQTQSREDYLASHPLTEEQIMADTEANEDEKLNAIDFLNGEDDSAISRFYYDGIYERAQKKEEHPLEINEDGFELKADVVNDELAEEASPYIVYHNGEQIGVLALSDNGKDFTIRGIRFDDKYRNKGLGKKLYKLINKKANEKGGVLYSDFDNTSESAKRVWESLEREGVAEQIPYGYRFKSANNSAEENIDKPFASLAEVKKFMDEIGYKGSLSRVLTSENGEKHIRYQTNGVVTPYIILGETTRRDVYKHFLVYGNVMDVNIPADVEAEYEREAADAKELRDTLYADDREAIKSMLTEAGISFFDVIDSERGSRIVFTDKKNENGNYTDWTDVSDPEQAREDIDFIKAKAERYKEDPMQAIERAANAFREEQKSQDQKDIDDALKEFNDFLDNAKGSNVLDKFMRKGFEGNDKAQASLLDAFTLTNDAQRMFLKDLLRLASKVGYAYIKSGVHDVQAWSRKMSDSIGAKLREVLGWDDAIIGEFVDEVWNQKYTVDGQRMRLSEHAERLKNTKPTDQTVNVNKKENNEPENVVSSQQEADLQGDSAEFAERQYKVEQLSKKIRVKLQGIVNWGDQQKPLSAYKQIAKELGIDNLSDTDLQELIETEVVNLAREIANKEGLTDEKKFQKIVKLYEGQPSLNARDNDRINKQQYSTPAPMAYLMGQFLSNGKKVESGLEPSAGNGMLTINLPKEKMHVNDIDEMRLSNLQKQGFGEVTSQDGLQSFGEKKFDVVVTNPPFGNVTPKVYDGIYEISGLEHQMAINALESMKDDGRAAIIIGGNTEYNQNGSIKGKDRAFLNYLYAHYNVVDVINMNGHELYSRQGTGFPVRMILINGRKEFNPRNFAPVIQKARAERVNSYDELYKRVNDDILSDSNKSAGVHNAESGESGRVDDSANAGNITQTGVRNVQPAGSQKQPAGRTSNGSSVSGSSNTTGGTDTKGKPAVDTRPTGVGSRTETSQPSGSTTEQAGEKRNEPGGNDTERPVATTDNSQRVGQRRAEPAQQPEQPAVKRGLGTEKVPYRKQSGNPFTLQSLMPAEQADLVKSALEELGDVDQFLVDELGYSSKEELHQALAAEQIDSVALAIHQMNQGNAFIIGDQTGIGKGRQAAALIRYGVKKGGFPVFITVKKALFSDMYRDLCDIGSPKLRPFIWSADDTEHSGNVTDKNGNVIYQTPNAKEQKRVIDYINKNGKLPPEYDYVLTTYDSFKSGTMDYEEGQKKERKFPKGKKPGPVHFNGQAKRDALETLAQNSYVIMDESHNAGGEGSNVSNYLQYITTKAKGLTFLSATFAKRPGNMPIYSLKTAISKAGVKVGELIDAVKRGGATFQEIMSKALTEAGQMIRRERDMTGVTIDWRGIEDEDIIQKQREQYDTVIGLFNDIIQFQRSYVDPIVNGMNDAAAEEQGEVDHTPGTRDMGINNTPFASRTYNMVQQVLLSLKAEEAAKRAIEHLKLGRKPVITVANTNEGAADEVAGADGESMDMPDLSVNLKKGLQGTMRITKKDAFGNTVNEMIPFDRLSEEGQKRYAEIMDAIENASSGLSLSPIDVIKNELKKAGYKVGELTGRKAEFVYNDDGTVKRVKRQDTDKKKIAADFNNGNIDALILNRSAGTGISLHASSTFKDQRQRIMIVAQAQGDVNDEVQIRGRIDRTGQVLRGMYEYVVSQIPSEQRLLMMLKAKLRSLDANTTSSQKSKFNEMQVQDIINKYGDDIVIQYLAEHPDLAMKMCDPLKWGEGAETLAPETLISQAQKVQGDGGTASKVLGRMALLTVKEQEKMLSEIGDLYQAEIDRLNEMGENDLEITEMPLRAKTVKKNVWEEGVEPGGKNPFADNSYVEEVEMDVLKKPMKAEEVKKSQERLLGGKTWDEYKQEQLDKVENWAEQKKEETRKTFTERAEKKATAEKEKYAKGAKKAQEKNGMTDAEIEKNAGYQYDTFYKQEMEKLDNALAAIDKQKQVFVDALDTFTTDGVYALPTDIYDLSQLTFEPSFGKVIDINIKEDNYSTTASTITFATLDGRRKITIPISCMVKQNNGEKRDIKPIVVQQTAQTRSGFFGSNIANMLKVLEQNIDNWDKLTSTATRKKGYIITGNLLKALTSLRSQNKGGKLISYTTDTGDVRQGILMSEQFEPDSLTSKNPISSVTQILKDGGQVVSADGDVVITKTDGIDWSHTKPGRHTEWMYQLGVPKSKKRGEKYFNDETLLSLMDDQFEGTSRMMALFPERNLNAVLKRLDELGVTVESQKEDNIDTSDPMKAINQAANSWRRSAKESESSLSGSSDVSESGKKSVPLERRTLKSYTDKNGNYHKGIEEELRDLESEISRRSSGESEEGGSKVDGASRATGRRGVSDLRREAAKLRAEIARRNQKKQELRKKYNIDEKGNISLSDLRRMFHDLNSNKILSKLFDKVCNILEKIGTQFRFTDKLEALTAGEAFGFFNTTFFNWDSFTRDRTDQEKAKTILHEVIHNIANQLLDRYTRTDLPSSVPELTDAQKKLAKEILDIYDVVDKAIPAGKNGEREFYGATDAYEMLSEMANPDFRKKLSTIPYRKGMNVLQKLIEWFKDVLGAFGFDYKGNTAFDSLNKALEDVIGNYDGEGIREYREIFAKPVRELRAVGLNEDIIDYVERYELNGGGTASKVEDKELIKKLEAEPKIKVYRAMQLQNGKLYPPMAAKVNGKWQDPLPLGEWSQADEHPELVDKNGKFDLDKGNGKKVSGVVYAPYMHGSTTMLNDQFKEAQDRPELVVVEAEMPESELTSGYQAEKSPRKVGMLDWKAGTIQGQLTGTRRVMLSRWVKPIRIVPSSEVAASIKEMIDGQVEVMPTNVVTPEQREELEKLGVKFVKTDNKEIVQEGEHRGEQYSEAYGKKSKKKSNKQKSVDGDPMQAIKDAAARWARSKADRDGETPEAHSAKAIYNERLNRVETVFSEAYQDAMVSLKTAQNAIAGDKDIPDSQNAYMAENLMHGKNKNEQDLFNRMFRDPLINTINKIMNLTGMNWGDVDRYVYTKSGLERNREFYVRDWIEKELSKTIHSYEDLNQEEQDIYDRMANGIETQFEDGDITEEQKEKKLSRALQEAHIRYVRNIEQDWQTLKAERYQDLKDGIITYADYINAMSDFIFRNIDYDYIPEEHDYSGFRAMYGDEDGKYDEEEIIDELMDTEDSINSSDNDAAQATTDTLWQQINAATRYGLERYREAGMRSDEQIDRVEQMFHFYVPMRGFKAETGEDMYQYFTGREKSKSYVGGLLKHAKGRGSEADFPISTIFAMSYKAISDCNQNLVNQKLYRLCQANPNDLIILSDSWAILNENTGEWEEVAPEIPEDATEDEVREITMAWEERMNDLAKEEKAKKITGKAKFDYKPMDKKKQSEHIIDVRINGQPRKMIVTGNPRMAQALNGQLRFENGRNVFSKVNAKIKNLMASLFTSYSPTFALRNMFRDWTHFRTMLGVREGHGYASQANKYYRQSLFKMVGLFKKYRDGKLDENNEMERDFKDFMDNGGITGFVFMQKIDDIQKEMENIYKKQKAGKPIRLNNKLWEYTLGAIEAVNEGIENNARFATYRASRHYAGRTKARSAYDAKEITVNFNRKGAGGKTSGFKSQNKSVEDAAKAFGVTSQVLGEGRIFFNATVQAIATTFKNFQNADGSLNKPYIAKWAMKYALPPFMFGLLLPAINKALAYALGGDDDDPYANLPEWTRRKNLCFYVGHNNFLTIPIGQELAAFLALGDIVAGNTYSPDLRPVDKNAADEVLGVLNTFSPVDVDTKITKGGLMENPLSEVTGRTFSVLAPIVAVEQNLGWTGRPIYREDKFKNDQYTPEYQMVYSGTNPVLVGASKALHELGGGDDIKRGNLEVNPAIVQYLWEQYTGGPGKVFSNAISLGKDAKDLFTEGEATDFNMRKVEGLKAFVQQGDDRTQYYRTQAKYRKYKADAEKLYDAVKGYEGAAVEDPSALIKLEEIAKGEDFVRMQIVREADKQLSQINKAANKAEGKERKELRRLYNEQVKAVVDMLDGVGEE